MGALKSCDNILEIYPVHVFSSKIGIVMFISGLCYIMMSLLTIAWIKSKELAATRTVAASEEAAKSVIFPLFVKVLWFSAFVSVFSGIVVTFLPADPVSNNQDIVAVMYSLMFAFQHAVIEGVAFLLLQKGCGKYAEKVAGYMTFMWFSFTFVLLFIVFRVGGVIGGLLDIIWSLALFIFYLLLFYSPQRFLFRRPAAYVYAQFWLYYRLSAMIINIMLLSQGIVHSIGICGYIFVSLILFALFQPLLCYYTLLQDSKWWQGFEISTAGRHENFDMKSPLSLGTDFSLYSAQSLAHTMDSMTMNSSVKMLNFAKIRFDFHSYLGAGSFSKVFRGWYGNQECAIKMIYTYDLTTDVINRVAAEASILSSFKHENVVTIYGVAVLPPSVCLLLELCSFGSLSDIIRGYGFDWSPTSKSPMTLSFADKLYLAWGCARGLAAVHSYDKNLCHRDIKSFNFLVDGQLNAKIADLELGIKATKKTKKKKIQVESHSGSGGPGNGGNGGNEGGSSGTNNNHDYNNSVFSSSNNNNNNNNISTTTNVLHDVESNNKPTSKVDEDDDEDDEELVNVEGLLANWMAPEVIRTRRFIQASDIYSLSLVFWEIFSGQLPFDGLLQPAVREHLRTGYRHPMPPDLEGTPIANLIQRAWNEDVSGRPTASQLEMEVRIMLHDECYSLCPDTDVLCDLSPVLNHAETLRQARMNSPTRASGYIFTQNMEYTNNNSTSTSTSTSSGTPLTAPTRTPKATTNVLTLIQNDPSWQSLEESQGAWAVFTRSAPHVLVYSTTTWRYLFGVADDFHMSSVVTLSDLFRDMTDFEEEASRKRDERGGPSPWAEHMAGTRAPFWRRVARFLVGGGWGSSSPTNAVGGDEEMQTPDQQQQSHRNRHSIGSVGSDGNMGNSGNSFTTATSSSVVMVSRGNSRTMSGNSGNSGSTGSFYSAHSNNNNINNNNLRMQTSNKITVNYIGSQAKFMDQLRNRQESHGIVPLTRKLGRTIDSFLCSIHAFPLFPRKSLLASMPSTPLAYTPGTAGGPSEGTSHNSNQSNINHNSNSLVSSFHATSSLTASSYSTATAGTLGTSMSVNNNNGGFFGPQSYLGKSLTRPKFQKGSLGSGGTDGTSNNPNTLSISLGSPVTLTRPNSGSNYPSPNPKSALSSLLGSPQQQQQQGGGPSSVPDSSLSSEGGLPSGGVLGTSVPTGTPGGGLSAIYGTTPSYSQSPLSSSLHSVPLPSSMSSAPSVTSATSATAAKAALPPLYFVVLFTELKDQESTNPNLNPSNNSSNSSMAQRTRSTALSSSSPSLAVQGTSNLNPNSNPNHAPGSTMPVLDNPYNPSNSSSSSNLNHQPKYSSLLAHIGKYWSQTYNNDQDNNNNNKRSPSVNL